MQRSQIEMNVLLVITNINGFHEVPYSFGLSSIASYIESKGYNPKILSISATDQFTTYIKEIKKFNPRVIGFSSVSSQFEYVMQLAELAKGISKEIVIVCGGVHPTLFPDDIRKTNDIDGFFIGESEIAFGEFLDKIKNNEEYRNTNNYVGKKNQKIIENPLNPLIKNLDSLPVTYKGALFKEFIKNNGHAPFFFSRGCPYSCSYCCNHAISKKYGFKNNKPRYRSVNSCITEIKDAIKLYRFNTVWIMDDTFGLDKEWRIEFCERYRREVNIRFLCNLRVNIVDEEFIKQLKNAGCYRILFGVESGNEYIRNQVMKRKISEAQIVKAFSLCREYRIESCALNIIGVPGETEEMIKETIKLNKRIKATDTAVNIYYPYKGTELGDYCFSKKLVDENRYNCFSNERRESILRYPEEHRKRLEHYQKNWAIIVNPFSIRKRIKHSLKKYKLVYNLMRNLKNKM